MASKLYMMNALQPVYSKSSANININVSPLFLGSRFFNNLLVEVNHFIHHPLLRGEHGQGIHSFLGHGAPQEKFNPTKKVGILI